MPERDCALIWTAVDGNDGWRGLHFFLLSQVNLEYFSLGKFFRDGISIHYSFLSQGNNCGAPGVSIDLT